MKITLKKGVTLELTPPSTYEVSYFNGTRTYNEPFVILEFSKEATEHELKPFRSVIDGMIAVLTAAGLATTGPTAGLGTVAAGALGLLVKVGGMLIEQKYFQTNPDGGMTQYMAYHYWGNATEGIDPTAWPLPGMDQKVWYSTVNSNIKAFQKAAATKPRISLAVASESDDAQPEVEGIATVSANPVTVSKVSMAAQQPNDLALLAERASFYDTFKGCMGLQGLPVPASLFESAAAAVATIQSIYTAVTAYGATVTISQLVAQGSLGSGLAVAGGVTAAYYLGACIGCGAYAGIGHLIPSAPPA